jgi:hypothetical protein
MRHFTVFLQELVGYTLIFTTIHLLYRLLLVPLSECGNLQSEAVPMDQSENVSEEQEGNSNSQSLPQSIAGNISEVISANCLR